MKLFGVVCSLLALGSTSVEAGRRSWRELKGYTFEEYVKDFSKSYEPLEYAQRSKQFYNTLAKIEAHNSQDRSWKMGVNHMTDLSKQELERLKGYSPIDKRLLTSKKQNTTLPLGFKKVPVKSLPETVDWRLKGVVTPVKDQGGCGSCWTFASAETIESHLAINAGVLVELSEQQLTSCMPNPKECGGQGGCKGATAELAFDFIAQSGGIASEWTYPYASHEGDEPTCKDKVTPYATIEGYHQLKPGDYTELMNAVAQLGPMSISVDASSWSTYEEGVYDGCNITSPDIDHAVQLVGYGTDKDLGDYWLVRNSWTPSWGEGGYIRVKRRGESEEGWCGTDTNPFDGTACKGDPDTVEVCGTCGILFDTAFPYGVSLAGK